MDELWKKQNSTMSLINNFRVNFNKVAKAGRTKGYIKTRIDLLKGYWLKFQQLHDDLLTKCDQKEDYFVKDKYTEIENVFCETLGYLTDQLDEKVLPSTQLSNDSTKPQEVMSSQLPKINLPMFSGDYLSWMSFRDLFTSIVHTAPISKVDKLSHLKGHLTDEAALILKNIALEEANYDVAWKLLKGRYENERIIIMTYLRKFTTLPVSKGETIGEVRRLLDTTQDMLDALKNLDRPVDKWDDWIIFHLTSKLDPITRKDWELSIAANTTMPESSSLIEFLEKRLRTLVSMGTKLDFVKYSGHPQALRSSIKSHHIDTSKKCLLCSDKHIITYCPLFRKQSIGERREHVQKARLCFNCLRADHSANNCSSESRCKQCNGKHHTMIHLSLGSPSSWSSSSSSSTGISNQTSNITSQHAMGATFNEVLLATAWVLVQRSDGTHLKLRALLDQGSQASFISEGAVQQLGITKVRVSLNVSGLASSRLGKIRNLVSISISSCYNTDFIYPTQALVVSHVTSYSPAIGLESRSWDHLNSLQLADPHYNKAGRIDLLLGADIFGQIVIDGIKQGHLGTPLAQNTTLGWILSGTTTSEMGIRHKCVLMVNIPLGGLESCSCSGLEHELRRFWSLEDVQGDISSLSKDERECEAFFYATCKRDDSGQYVVRLPRKQTLQSQDFSQTRQLAVRRLSHVERRFEVDRGLRDHYQKFMADYLNLGHMEVSTETSTEKASHPTSYLPHHAVASKDAHSTKFRVVFDASSRVPNGTSLNDCLHVGPKLQRNLTLIVTQWRIHPVVFKADIEKMFRQIRVNQEDCDLQRIVWRNPTTDDICDFRLLTVTYGTACAPYLAIKTLLKLAEDDGEKFPDAATVVRNEFYVDDVLSGGESVQVVLKLRDDLISLLQGGGFTLKKWASNEEQVLADLPEDMRESKVSISSKIDGIKTLGLHWSPEEDTFSYTIGVHQHLPEVITKRHVLGDIARLFDPLGWLAPSIILGKIFLQKLWSSGLQWDDPLPSKLQTEWLAYREGLGMARTIRMDRWVGTHSSQLSCELHGFCDASTVAYSAAVYIRVTHDVDNIQVSLLMAKTKVAPLKTTSIPWLELCGAVLLSRLIKEVRQIEYFKNMATFAWTDSTVALAWIRGEPSRWKTFVANRVAEVQDAIDISHWRHVPSEDNPADCASRGLYPSKLASFSIWWTGPFWLCQQSSAWPDQYIESLSRLWLEESKSITSSVTIPTERWSILSKFSSHGKLFRVIAYCRRFIFNCKQPKSKRNFGFLERGEMWQAELSCIKLDQQHDFFEERLSLHRHQLINVRSPLLKLAVWLDDDDLLRLGGRLQEAHIPFGIQSTLSYTRQKFWILGARNEVRKHIHRCVICYRQRAKGATQLMGNLPAARVQQCRPFIKSGVDYAGPISIRQNMGRRIILTKGYICVFVCLATRAIHIELASDLSTDAFIAAYKRFTSRRGICSDLFSDRGTNFVGADRQLRECLQRFGQENNIIGTELAQMGTSWHFIPPGSPHFGGIWEAAVKSTKHHLRRILGDRTLRYEELSTLLSQIEAVLNSRPLMPLRDDPLDFEVLTPAHFLIGQPLTTVPEPDLNDTKSSYLKRWQLIQQIFHHFWKTWSKDYLHQLQQRPKWTTQAPSIRTGQLVLIKDDRLPPSQWSLGRVELCHPGPDGLIRVVTLRNSSGTFKRSITKICPLPLEEGLQQPDNRSLQQMQHGGRP